MREFLPIVSVPFQLSPGPLMTEHARFSLAPHIRLSMSRPGNPKKFPREVHPQKWTRRHFD
jgi:hypothetical protein